MNEQQERADLLFLVIVLVVIVLLAVAGFVYASLGPDSIPGVKA